MQPFIKSKYLWQHTALSKTHSQYTIHIGTKHKFTLQRQLPDTKWWAICIENPNNARTISNWNAPLKARENLEDAIKAFENWLDENYPNVG